MIDLKMDKKTLNILLIFGIFFAFSACSLSWEPSDEEAIRLVKKLYMFSYEGKRVDATIILRKEYIPDCECYPIVFEITDSEQRRYRKTFYFFKNEFGEIDVREHRYGVKTM